MKTTTKYVVVRDTLGAGDRHYRRYNEYGCDEKDTALFVVNTATITSTKTTVSLYEVEGELAKKSDVLEVGKLIYAVRGNEIIFEAHEQEHEDGETCANAEENSANANAEPVMSEWRVSSNGWGEDKSYQVYRRIDVNATDHSGNRENRGGVFDNRAEAQAYADKLNAGIDPEEEAHVEAKEAEPEMSVERAVAEDAPEGADGKEEADFSREPVRYYAVLLIAENRKQTKFHYKRKMFWDDQQAIDFARSRLRGGCRAAWVYMYDPVTVKVPPELFESDNPKRDTDNIGKFLGRLEIFRIDSHSWSDMRDRVYAEIREADKVQATA